MMEGVDTIIWDWNGTLLNDVDICIDVINELLIKRKHQVLDKDRYLEIFTFPVKDYYAEAGFDFSNEPFDKIAIEKDRCCLIGDTIHDYEVANELGVRCLQVAKGHQSYKRLVTTGCDVVTELNATLAYFKINHFDIIYNSNEESK